MNNLQTLSFSNEPLWFMNRPPKLYGSGDVIDESGKVMDCSLVNLIRYDWVENHQK